MRQIFDSLGQLVEYIQKNPTSRQTPYEVEIDGTTKYTLSGNSDQAIAAVARKMGARVTAVPISRLLQPVG